MEQTAIVPSNFGPPADLTPAPLETEPGLLTPEIVKEIEAQVDMVRRVRLAVCKLTEPEHWRDFNGKPYLMDGGIHAVASTIGLEFGEPRTEKEVGDDEKGAWLAYRCAMLASWRGRTLHEIGYASSRDDLYKGKPLADVDGDILKKSVTNAQHRLLTKITGLGGVTWGLLESVGIRRGQGGTTRFKGQEQKATTGSGGWTPRKERFWGLLLELNGGDEKLAGDALQDAAKTRDCSKLSNLQVEALFPLVEEEYQKWQEREKASKRLTFAREAAAAEPARETGQEG